MRRRMLVATGCGLVTVLILSVLGSLMMPSSSLVTTEPSSLRDLTAYPFAVEIYPLDQGNITWFVTELNTYGSIHGLPLQGYGDMREQMSSKGYEFSDMHVEIERVVVTSPDGIAKYNGYTYRQWSGEGPAGTKVLLAGAVMADGSSIIVAAATNILPPDQMPGVDPFIIWNAEPYFYAQFFWWHTWPYSPYWYIRYWKYWWYDSHKTPNWFWGIYSWWRTYIKYYPSLTWYPWYWWWWSWYYWRGWYWWSTEWIY